MIVKIETIKKGCPVCNNTVKGNQQIKYYCKNCNILFSQINNEIIQKRG